MDSPALRVAISIQQRVPQWQIPEASALALMSRFPDLRFTYARSEPERAEALASADVAFTWRLSAEELAAAPNLRWVHSSAVAVDWFCLPELAARGVRVSNTRGVQAVPIAEHVLAVMLALAKQLPFALENQARAIWAQEHFTGSRQPWLLNRRTLGIVGLGSIGQALALRASALGMSVVALRRQTDAPRSAACRPCTGAIGCTRCSASARCWPSPRR
jgi:phosphoglycerate dehydrogenase-like enzyme